jgi:hypothetical protein
MSATSGGFFRTWGPGIALAAATLLLWAAAFPYYSRFGKHDDPDYFFHLALGREFADGLVRAIPQAEDLGWGQYFPDKDFLFHWLLGRLHDVGGIPAQETLPVLLGVAWWAFWVVVGASAPRALVGVAVFWLGSVYLAPFFFVRFQTLRPFVLSTLCAVVMVLAILRARRWSAAIAAAGFALTYSAFFVPAAFALTLLLAAGREAVGHWRARAETFALGALLGASIVHPYFPSNYVAAWVTWSIGFATPEFMNTLRSGGELRPLSGRLFWFNYGWSLAACAVSAAVLLRERAWKTARGRQYLCVLVWAATFWLYATKSHRAVEYAVPLTGLLFTAQFPKLPWQWAGLRSLTIASLAVQATFVLPQLPSQPTHLADHTFRAIEHLARAPVGSKVFNCEWDAGAYLLFARPDLRFVDAFDPYLMYHANRKKALFKAALVQGRAKAPLPALRQVFKSDYVLCSAPGLLRQLAGIPTVRFLTSTRGTGAIPAVVELPRS